jgi:hypothetical protein
MLGIYSLSRLCLCAVRPNDFKTTLIFNEQEKNFF